MQIPAHDKRSKGQAGHKSRNQYAGSKRRVPDGQLKKSAPGNLVDEGAKTGSEIDQIYPSDRILGN